MTRIRKRITDEFGEVRETVGTVVPDLRDNVITGRRLADAGPRRSLLEFPYHLESEPQRFAIAQVLSRGNRLAVGDAERKELLERVRAGEHVELEIEAVTYIQRETPNRNFVRFKKQALRALATSGKGTPFLTNHDQCDVNSRGGTIVKSALVTNGAGEAEIHQTLRLVKPWAVEGVLDGTIDRFSIGWRSTGAIVYRHNREVVEDWPRHWPGDEIETEDGTIVVEWEFTSAELVETSAVNVPAVVGTGIAGFRAALAAHLGGSPSEVHVVASGVVHDESPRVRRSRFNEALSRHQEDTMNRLFKRLGLSADASEESVLAAVDKLEQGIKDANDARDAAALELKTERAAHDVTKTALAAFEKAEEDAKAAKVDALIAKLYAEGKLVKAAGQPDEAEADLRSLAGLGIEKAERQAARMTVKIPVGKQAATEGGEARGVEVVVASDDGFLPIGDKRWLDIQLSDRQLKQIASMGVSEQAWREGMARGGAAKPGQKGVN